MDDRFIREPECERITGLSRTTRWRLERAGRFPKRRKLSENAVGWLESELQKWLENKANSIAKIAFTLALLFLPPLLAWADIAGPARVGFAG